MTNLTVSSSTALPYGYEKFLKENESFAHLVQLQSDWLNAYIKNYIKLNDVLFFSFYSGDELVGVLPVQIQSERVSRWVTLRKWIPLASGPSDFYPILFEEKWRVAIASSFSAYVKENSKNWDEIVLDNIPKTDLNLNALQGALAEVGKVKVAQSNGFVWVNTQQTWAEYYERFLKKRNKDLWKDMRKLERAQINLHLETVTENVFSTLTNVLDLYAKRRAALGQENKYDDASRQGFVRDVVNAREKKGTVALSLLKDDDHNTWAFQLDWIENGIRYHWNHAYNHDFKKYSPGKLLLYKLMEADFNNPTMQACNHMRGLAGYKTYLADQQEALMRLTLTNPKSIPLKKLKAIKKVAALKNKWI